MITFTAENIFLFGSFLVLISILISKTGYRFGIPTLLLFLFTGMGFGKEGLGLTFDSPKDTQMIGMIALSVILFSGGMGYQVQGNQAHYWPRCAALHVGCHHDHRPHGRVYLWPLTVGWDGYQAAAHRVDAAGGHHVIHRLSISLQPVAHTTHWPEAQAAPNARAGER